MIRPSLLLLSSLCLTLAACGVPGSTNGQTSSAPELQSQASASGLTLQTGQTRQLSVLVGGTVAQPGQLTWTTSSAGVVTVTQTGLVRAVGVGSATVRATLAATPTAYVNFQVTVTAAGAAPAPGGSISATEQRVLDLTNQARATARTCGTTSYPAAAPLTWNASLAAAARGHAADMAAKDYFSHTSQDGRTFDVRITNAGYTGYRAIGENIAAGQPTPEEVVAGWIKSPGHCANLMNASFKELGVGVGNGGSYGIYWDQDFGAKF